MTPSSTAPTFNLRSLASSKDVLMALAIVLIIGMMIVPMPPAALDLLIVLNLAVSLGIILLTINISRPLDFSIFPTVLLLVTLFRLGINVSASRLILLQGDAGKVIATFGELIVGGNYVIGIVVFLILMIIQWVVINSGAGRVAEVAARFTLDAMPGKQMSIDADMNAGLLTEAEARIRRKEVQREANFYGAMDGASKFVKGDAIAAIIVTIINILGGFVIGMVQRGLSLTEALQSYTLVTVGAGLAIQIPALLISAAAGMLVTRSASESSLGDDLAGQLSNFNMLLTGAVIMAALALVPGMPKLPFLFVGAGLGGAAYFVRTGEKVSPEETAQAPEKKEAESPQEMMKMLVVDPMEVEVGYGLVPLVDEDKADNLLRRVTAIRRQIMEEVGLVLPVVRVRDNLHLKPQAYRIKIRGQEVAHGELMVGRFLAVPGSNSDDGKLNGIPTTEPAFGLPAMWITDAETGRAELAGYTVVAPLSVISTHLTEVVRGHVPDLLDRQMVQEMIGQLRAKTPAAVEGVVPEMLGLGEVQAVLRNLLRERVPVRDLGGILEVLASHAGVTRDPNILAEAVRQSMSRTLSNQYRDPNGYLHVITLSPHLEAHLRASLGRTDGDLNFQIDAELAQKILIHTGEQMEKLAHAGYFPILLCSREVRLAFRRLIERALPNLVILAFSEVSWGTRVKAHGMVEVTAQRETA
ncbi:MAG: flagellar biosynthesis protein FlhA [Anaerolineales bacterium]|nr:flagellar biosynthesis protein FlhA [Anaerolineales bacterium]